MSRPEWKGPFIYTANKVLKKNTLKTMNRNSKIVPNLLNQTVEIHNGKSKLEIIITKEMLGHKFGEFVSTRAKFSFKKKKAKK